MSTNFGQIGEVFVGVRADLSGLRAQMQGAGSEFEKIGQRIGARISSGLANVDFNKTGQQLQNLSQVGSTLGRGLTAGVTLPLAAAGAAAIKFGGDFDSAMTQSLAIMDDTAQALRGEMVDAAKEMARETTFSATEAAESYFFLASAGLDAQESIDALPVVAKFAQAGMFDMARATDLLTDAQSALGKTIKGDSIANMREMVKISDVLVKANTIANATVEQFAESLTNRGGAALRLVNKEATEGVAVLAAWADQGVKGVEAGTRLDIVLRDLQKSANENQAEFAAAGVAVFDSSGKMNNMADIVRDLEGLLEGMSDQQKRATVTQLGFQERTVSAVLSLLGMSDAIDDYQMKLESAGGTTERVAELQLASFSAQMKLLKNEVQLAGIELFQGLRPILEDDIVPLLQSGARFLTSLAEKFADLPPGIRKVTIAGAALAAALGPIVLILSSIAGSIGTAFIALGTLTGTAGAAGAGAAGTGLLGAGTAAVLLKSSLALLGPAAAIAAGALLGIKAGQAINELTGLDEALADATERLINFANAQEQTLGQQVFNVATGGIFRNAEIDKANASIRQNIEKTITMLRAQGEDVSQLYQRAGESLDDFADRVRVAVQTSQMVTDRHAELNAVVEESGMVMDDTAESADNLAGQELEAAQRAAELAAQSEAAAKAQEQLEARFEAALNPAADLNEEIGQLIGKMGEDDIVRVYGDAILAAADATRKNEQAVPPLIARLEQRIRTERAAKAQADLLIQTERDLREAQIQRAAALDELNRKQEISNILLSDSPEIPPPPPPDAGINRAIGVVDEFDAAVLEAEEQVLRTEERVAALIEELGGIEEVRKDPEKLAKVIAFLGDEIKQADRNAERFGIELGHLTVEFQRQIDAAEQAAESAEKWQRVWENAMGNVVSEFSGAVADMIFEGERFAIDVGGIFKQLGKTIVKTLVTDAFTRVAQGFSNLLLGGPGGGGLLGGLLGGFGGGGGSGGGLLGGLLGGLGGTGGGLLGGILGGGGGVVPGHPDFVGPVLPGATGGGGFLGALGTGFGGGLGFGLGGLAVSGISALIGKIGAGRKAADALVGSIQAPFMNQVRGLLQGLHSARSAGTLTIDQAEQTREQLNTLINQTLTAAGIFAGQSDKANLVVRQWMEDIQKGNGEIFREWFDQINNTIAALQAQGDPAAVISPGGGTLPSISDGGLLPAETIQMFSNAVGVFETAALNLAESTGSVEDIQTFSMAVETFETAALHLAHKMEQDMAMDRETASAIEVGNIILQFQEPAAESEIEQLKEWFETNKNGLAEKLIQIIRVFDSGVVSGSREGLKSLFA